ncbi:MAG: peptidoglycan-associated lipoprotein Pal [bacterium]|nr:peptidoglycan-associated lipoprotein Pal [bacterium]
MKAMTGILLVILMILSLLSGCCPYSRKVPPAKAPSKEQPIEKPQIEVKQVQTPSEKPTIKPSEKGIATEAEIMAGTIGGEIPPVKPDDQPKFVIPTDETKEIFQPIYFDFDKYNIKTSEHPKLNAIADYLKKNPDISILIEGHCDERGTDEYNLVLGEKRALSTRNFLVALGISPKRIYTISYGESRPADPGHNEEAWAKNRRAEFKIKQ